MTRVFISYRRSDSEHIAGRIYDFLEKAFGREKVFKDVDSIPLGSDFREVIARHVAQCDVVVAVIGPTWLEVVDGAGERRLDDPEDLVRLEIEAALSRDIPVIPALVAGSSMPARERLPDSIQSLVFRNAISIRPDPDFRKDMGRLTAAIRGIRGRTWIGKSLVAAAIAAVGTLAIHFVVRQPTMPGDVISTQEPSGPISRSTTRTSIQTPTSRYMQGGQPSPGTETLAPASEQVTAQAHGEPTTLRIANGLAWDSESRLLWVRNLFALGNSKELFKGSSGGTATITQDLNGIRQGAAKLPFGDQTGWRIATQNELKTLQSFDGSALFQAFFHQPISTGARNLIAIFDNGRGGVASWGYQYANYLRGPYEEDGAYRLNDYGVWLVSGPVDNPFIASEATVIRAAPEERTERRLKPLSVGVMAKTGDTITDESSGANVGFVGNVGVDDRRSVFQYNLKPLDQGAFVRAEIVMEARQTSGTGTVTVSIYDPHGTFQPTVRGDWAPKALDDELPHLIQWNGLGRVRYELAEHVMRNLFSQHEWVGIHCRYDGRGDVRFVPPELIVTYIRKDDLLLNRRALPTAANP